MAKRKKINKDFLNNIEIPAVVATLIVAIIIISSLIMFGIELALVMTIGTLLIVGVAKLLDKVKKKKKLRRLLNILLILFFLAAIAVMIAIAGFCIYIVKESPEFDIAKLTKREASIVYDKDGNEIGRFGNELRENISYDDLPEVFIDALIATEDSRFFQHNGFDAPRFFKASVGQALGSSGAGGASTLTMQLSKNTFTDVKQQRSHGIDGIIRKFEDIYISVFKLEKNFTKEEIIEYYVNNYDLGNNAYGVEQASQTIFAKSVTELNLAEAATLVGIFNNPTKYNPVLHPEESEKRRNTVLNLMVKHGYITKEEANAAKSIPVSSLVSTRNTNKQYQAYIDTVYYELKNKHGINPNTTSVLVYTNMDATRQKGIDEVFNGNTRYQWLTEKVQGSTAIVEINTGKLVAVGQGRNRTAANMPLRATDPDWGRQIGSTAKPIFDYGPAIEYLNWSTYQQVVDEPWSYSTGQSIGNADGNYLGQISIRTALEQSKNIPALKTFQTVAKEAGNDKIYEFVTNLGIKPGESNGVIYEACSIGAFDGTTPLQMAAAYAAFANGGTYYEPYTINRIVYRENNDVKNIKVEGKRVMSEATAFMITDMLHTAVTNGISSGARVNGVNVAAKTGTSNFTAEAKRQHHLASDAVNDSWIVGYDPEYSIAMWYGYDKATDGYNRLTSAGTQRGKLFNAIGTVIFNKSGKDFSVPNSVDKICVEKGSNPPSLPSQYTPADQITCEYFKKGTEPTEVSTAYQKIDKVKNLKVTYDEKTETIKITWSRVETPNSNEGYGAFGYNVYYGDVLLGFTQETSYSLKANTNISGTYKVVATFENYTNNQSDPAEYKFVYTEPKPTPTPTPKPTATTVPVTPSANPLP